MILEGRRILVTGVLSDASIAFGVAKVAQEQGAEVVLSSFGRVMSITERVARKLPSPPQIVGLDFDNSRQAWPVYDWMGVAKAALESTARYLARDLGPAGIRVNLVAAGPLRTMAARSIPGFEQFESVWTARAPLGWDLRDTTPTARAVVALLSDWFPATTGEIIHVDGGFHAVGA